MSTRIPHWLITGILLLFLTGTSVWAQNLDIPFRFEENRGQEATRASYIGWAAGYTTEMSSNEVVMRGAGEAVHMSFGGGRNDVAIQALDAMPASTDVYDGRTGQFHTGLRNYRRLRYSQVYPGIDVVFRGTG